MASTETSMAEENAIAFAHIELHVDHLEDLSVYKDLERKVNAFASQIDNKASIADKEQAWSQITGSTPGQPFVPQNRDIVQ